MEGPSIVLDGSTSPCTLWKNIPLTSVGEPFIVFDGRHRLNCTAEPFIVPDGRASRALNGRSSHCPRWKNLPLCSMEEITLVLDCRPPHLCSMDEHLPVFNWSKALCARMMRTSPAVDGRASPQWKIEEHLSCARVMSTSPVLEWCERTMW